VDAGTSTKTAPASVRWETPSSHQAVQVDVQVGGAAEALNQRDRTAGGLPRLESGLLEQQARDGAVHDKRRKLVFRAPPSVVQRAPKSPCAPGGSCACANLRRVA